MKILRIAGAVFGAALITVMFSCGGSSFLTEAPMELWNEDDVVLRFHAVGFETPLDSSGQTGLAKDFFVTDAFSGDGVLTGDTLNETIDMKCQFDSPSLSANDGGALALIDLVEQDPNLCSDLRNCCVYELNEGAGLGYQDECSIFIECIADEDLARLDFMQIDLTFNVWQDMTTSMRSDSGLITTSIVEQDETNDPSPLPTNQTIFTVHELNINRDNCTGLGGSDTFQINDDDIWKDIEGQNAPDILGHVDLLWNVDSIGSVDIAGGVGDVSNCDLYYESMPGTISLAPLFGSSPSTIEELIRIDGEGKICNSRSYTDCGGATPYDTAVAELTLNMYEPTLHGENLTFAQADVHHICGDVEASEANDNGDGCHPDDDGTDPEGFWSSCLPYLINDVEEEPDGCMNLCFDYRGLIDPESPHPNKSQMATYLDAMDLTGTPEENEVTCGNNGGVWLEVDVGVFLCLPQQLAVCIPEECAYSQEDMVTVCDPGDEWPVGSGEYGCDEELADAKAAVFDSVGTEGDSTDTLAELYQQCGEYGTMWLIAEANETNDPPTARSDAGYGICQNVLDRFLDNGEVKPLLIRVAGDDIKTVVGDLAELDPFALLDQDLLPNGIHRDTFIDGDLMWRYGLSSRYDFVTPNGLKVYTEDKQVVDGADAISISYDIKRVRTDALDQCFTDDTNLDYDYQIEIALRTPLLGDTQPVGLTECGEGGGGAMHFFYNIVDVDCGTLGDYVEPMHATTIGTNCEFDPGPPLDPAPIPCDDTVQEARDRIFDSAAELGDPTHRTFRDFAAECGSYNVRMRPYPTTQEIDQTVPACVAVADRFFVDSAAAAGEHVLNGDFSFAMIDTSPAPGDPWRLNFQFAGTALFPDLVDGFADIDFDETLGVNDYHLTNIEMTNWDDVSDVYDAVGGNPVDAEIIIARIKLDETMPTKGDGRGYHYRLNFVLHGPHEFPERCAVGGTGFYLSFEVDGNCISDD